MTINLFHLFKKMSLILRLTKCVFDFSCRHVYFKYTLSEEEYGTQMGKYFYDKMISLGPIFIKYGQLVASLNVGLHDNFFIEARKLLDKANTMTDVELKDSLKDYDINKHFKSFDYTPFSAGSIAQVHKAVLKNSETVVVKILKHGIKEDIELNLYILSKLINMISIVLKKYDLSNRFEYTSVLMKKQTDFKTEAIIQNEFHDKYKYNKLIYVPKIYEECCTDTIIVMEYIDGKPLHKLLKEPEQLKEIGKRVTGFFLTSPYFGYIHMDLHPSNIFYRESDSKLCILDFGIVAKGDVEKVKLFFEMSETFIELEDSNITDIEAYEDIIDLFIDLVFIKNVSFREILNDVDGFKELQKEVFLIIKNDMIWERKGLTKLLDKSMSLAYKYNTTTTDDINNSIISSASYMGTLRNLGFYSGDIIREVIRSRISF